jgi:oxygen-independent coproporphyrinogen-3 oxidase
MKMTIAKHNISGPRYTSYPTAPQWSADVDPLAYPSRLAALGRTDRALSLYFHIPFCQSMCRYCGCNVVIRKQRPEVGDIYVDALIAEMALLAAQIGHRQSVRQLHLGGGTPNYLSRSQLQRLMSAANHYFDIDFTGDISVEVDPRTLETDTLSALRELGFNRLSMGLQDFTPEVQAHIGRIQPYEVVRSVFEHARKLGFLSINIDLIYGLPYQTPANFRTTIEKVLSLSPDRIALYSYAHVPWLKSHQKLLHVDAMPDQDAKLQLFVQSRDLFLESGYIAIAMDHFAAPTDDLAAAFTGGRLHRNFMGYTTKPVDEFIGLGVTAIGFLDGMFSQNTHDLAQYYQRVQAGKLPTEKGMVLSEDDRVRQWVIQQLMCQMVVKKPEFMARFGVDFDAYFSLVKPKLDAFETEGFLTHSPDAIQLTPLGHFFVRNVCMAFDAYLEKSPARYSKTV